MEEGESYIRVTDTDPLNKQESSVERLGSALGNQQASHNEATTGGLQNGVESTKLSHQQTGLLNGTEIQQ